MRISIYLSILLFLLSSCSTTTPVDDNSKPFYQKTAFQREIKKLPHLNSLLIQKDGKLVFEKYFNNSNKDELQDLRSVTKSVVSLLTGIAIEQGHIHSVEDKTTDYFSNKLDYADSITNELQIKHLLTMTDGFEYKESKEFLKVMNSAFPSEYITIKKIIHPPGEKFNYSSATANFMGLILTKATKKHIVPYAKPNFFDPMEITKYKWAQGADGIYTGGAGLMLKSRDLIKIGNLFFTGGKYKGKQIVSKEWLTTSTTPFTKTVSKKWGAFTDIGYGYYWWTATIAEQKVFFALGYSGQFILIVPDKKLIIVTTSKVVPNPEKANEQEEANSRLMAYIIGQTP